MRNTSEDPVSMNCILSLAENGRLGDIYVRLFRNEYFISREMCSFIQRVHKIWEEYILSQLEPENDPFSKFYFIKVIDYFDEKLADERLYKDTKMRQLFLDAKRETESLPDDDGEHRCKILFGNLLLLFIGIDETFNNSSED